MNLANPTTSSLFPTFLTALATPFKKEGIAEKTFAEHVAWQIEQGSKGLVVGGATGEASTLTHDEHRRLMEIAVETADGRAPIIVATGTNCTSESIALTRAAEVAGAAAAMLVTPYYNKPHQEGLYRHYRDVARSVGLPIIVEHDPSSTAIEIRSETLARISEIANIVAVAEVDGLSIASLNALSTSSDLIRLSGDDATSNIFRMAGGQGSISIIANVAPSLWAALQKACDAEDWRRAASIQHDLQPLLRALRLEPNPAPVKYALSLLRPGYSPKVRLPLVAVSKSTAAAIEAALCELQLV